MEVVGLSKAKLLFARSNVVARDASSKQLLNAPPWQQVKGRQGLCGVDAQLSSQLRRRAQDRRFHQPADQVGGTGY